MLKNIIKTVIITYFICILWMLLELMIYGEVQNREVDNVMMLMFMPIIYKAVSNDKEEIENMAKKLVCGCFGNIYYASILKDGLMSSKDRVDVTDDAINAVMQHILDMDGYRKKQFAGYEFDKSSGDGTLCLCVFDKTKYKLVPTDSNISEEKQKE